MSLGYETYTVSMYMLGLLDKSIFSIFDFLLLVVCPLLFPNIGEQQYRKDKEHVFWFRDNIAFVRRHCQETLERGDTVQALRILDDAIGRIPVAGFYQQRAKLYAETGDFQKAEKDYLFLRHLAPTSWNVVLELARLYHQMNRTWEALELLEPYTKISPKGKTLEQKALLLEIREFAILVKEVI